MSQIGGAVAPRSVYPTLLDMVGIQPQPGQRFDGISILPALQGQPPKREAIFCHFPHSMPAAGNVPGAWVRKGDWKLIRLWCENDDQTDRLELYNLKKDIGETRDLAAREAGRVKEMAALLYAFLRHTNAVIPKRNPNYRRRPVRAMPFPPGW